METRLVLNATAKAMGLIKTEPVLSDENHSIHSVSTGYIECFFNIICLQNT